MSARAQLKPIRTAAPRVRPDWCLAILAAAVASRRRRVRRRASGPGASPNSAGRLRAYHDRRGRPLPTQSREHASLVCRSRP